MLPVSSVLSFSKRRKKIEFLMKSHKRTPIKTGCYRVDENGKVNKISHHCNYLIRKINKNDLTNFIMTDFII